MTFELYIVNLPKTVIDATWQASNHHPALGLGAPRWSWNSQDQKENQIIYMIVSWQKMDKSIKAQIGQNVDQQNLSFFIDQ